LDFAYNCKYGGKRHGLMSSSSLIEWERKKLKMEWEQLPNPKPTWEDYKRMKARKTFK